MTPLRLPALARRQAIVSAALRVFSSSSYTGATTAEIAREAGVSEPIIYRHFHSKRDLWFACLEEAWDRFRTSIEERAEALGDAESVRAVAQTGVRLRRERVLLPSLWLQGVTEAAEAPEVEKVVRRHLREVHALIAGLVRRSQAAGGVPADRDADAEAWLFVAGGLLVSVADRLGGLLTPDDLRRIAEQRYRWLLDG